VSLRRLWVLVVTEGSGLLATPEVYRSRVACQREAERLAQRWARSLRRAIEEVEDAFIVGRRRASVLGATATRIQEGDGLFVGLVLTADGGVAVGPELASDRGTSRAWVEQFRKTPTTFVSERPGDDTLYRFRRKGRTLVAVSSFAKAVAPFPALLEADAPERSTKARYEIELSVRYTHVVLATIEDAPGLSREQVEDRVDEDFPNIARYTGAPVDVDWSLESVQERGSYAVKVQDPDE
jgi:hypothetical protein